MYFKMNKDNHVLSEGKIVNIFKTYILYTLRSIKFMKY
mgnify:CR=1 FL=1